MIFLLLSRFSIKPNEVSYINPPPQTAVFFKIDKTEAKKQKIVLSALKVIVLNGFLSGIVDHEF